MEPILVTGGTGTLGRHVVRRLRQAGRDLRVLTRRASKGEEGVRYLTGDLLAGVGIEAAVAGVSTIVHCAGSPKGDEVATRNLVDAAARTGQPHLVYISVVGAERIPVSSLTDRTMFSYFDMKRKAEEVVSTSGVPWTTIRSTQFHDLVFAVVEKLAKLPVVPAPFGFSFQPVDTDEVAARLVELALGPPGGLAPDIAGPRVYGVGQLIRGYLAQARKHRLIMPVWLPGGAARAIRAGANLAPERAVGKRTWDDFLAARLSTSSPVASREERTDRRKAVQETRRSPGRLIHEE